MRATLVKLYGEAAALTKAVLISWLAGIVNATAMAV